MEPDGCLLLFAGQVNLSNVSGSHQRRSGYAFEVESENYAAAAAEGSSEMTLLMRLEKVGLVKYVLFL